MVIIGFAVLGSSCGTNWSFVISTVLHISVLSGSEMRSVQNSDTDYYYKCNLETVSLSNEGKRAPKTKKNLFLLKSDTEVVKHLSVKGVHMLLSIYILVKLTCVVQCV